MESSPPAVPVAASWDVGAPIVCTVRFDKQLMPRTAFTPSNWSARYSDNEYQYVSGYVQGNKAFITMSLVGADIGADIVNYFAVPEELHTQGTGIAVATFIDQPIT